MTVTPLGWDQDCSLKIREPEVLAPWFLDPGGWSKTATVSLYFIFPGICTLSLEVPPQPPPELLGLRDGSSGAQGGARGTVTDWTTRNFGAPGHFTVAAPGMHRSCNAGSCEDVNISRPINHGQNFVKGSIVHKGSERESQGERN
ncbi:hypothetical protein STEG23_035124 [Scotinomys teguina]